MTIINKSIPVRDTLLISRNLNMKMSRTSWLYLLAEFGPTLSFFIAGRLLNFYQAVIILMVATTLACLLAWYLENHLPALPLMSAFFVLVGGFVTLAFHHPDAVIFTDTLYYLTAAIILGVTLPKNILVLKRLFEPVFAIEDIGWIKLSWRWFWFLLLAACSNEVVRIMAGHDFWIDYRFYKTIVITIFATYQIRLMARYRMPELSTKIGLRNIELE